MGKKQKRSKKPFKSKRPITIIGSSAVIKILRIPKIPKKVRFIR